MEDCFKRAGRETAKMTNDEPLQRILDAAGIDGELNSMTIGKVSDLLGFDQVTADEFAQAVSQFADWDGEPAPTGEFELRVGEWHLDLASTTIRASLMAAILGGVLVATSTTGLGVALAAAIVPSVIEVDRVTLSQGDRQVLFELQRLPNVTDRLVRSDELYESLPEPLRMHLNRYDFADLLERLRAAGSAVGDEAGRLVRIRASNESVPKISWR